MPEPTRNVLFLADRPGEHDDGWPIGMFLDRLAKLGISGQVLCVTRPAGAGADSRVMEANGLRNRWVRPLAVRRLGFGEGLKRPDLIHAIDAEMGPAALSIAETWEVPYLLTAREFLPEGGWLRLSKRWCRGLIAASRDLAEDLVVNLKVPADFLSVVSRGVAVADEPTVAARPGKVPVIGTAGALVPSSGMATFLNAARRVTDTGVDAEFVIAGHGEDEYDLRRRAARLKIADRVTFTNRSLLGLRFWSVLDLFCQMSLIPTVGRTLAIAQSFGVPALASDVEGLRALVAHEANGVLVPPGDSTALAHAILDLLANPERARRLGARGREAVRRDLNPEAEAESLAAVYRQVLDEGAFRPAVAARAVEAVALQ